MTIPCNKNIIKQLNSYSYVIAITLQGLLQRTKRVLRIKIYLNHTPPFTTKPNNLIMNMSLYSLRLVHSCEVSTSHQVMLLLHCFEIFIHFPSCFAFFSVEYTHLTHFRIHWKSNSERVQSPFSYMQLFSLVITNLQKSGTFWHQELSDELRILPPTLPMPKRLWQSMC